MPFDQRRNNGPDTSVAYRFHSKINLKTYEDKLKEAFLENKSNEIRRADNRKLNEPRKIFLKTNMVSQAKGSAYIEVGATKVIVSVFDPREIHKQNNYSILGELYCDFKYSSFACTKRRLPQTDSDEKAMALSMKRALESLVCRHEFPNFQVDIFANVLEDDGSVLSAAITCAGLALIDAGIPLYDIITASTVAIIQDKILLDPTAAEEDLCNNGWMLSTKSNDEEEINENDDNEHGVIMMAKLATHDQISELWQCGSFSLETIKQAKLQLNEINQEIVGIVKRLLVKNVQKSVRQANDIVDDDDDNNK